MNTSQPNCQIRRNILFVLKSSAFNGDRNYQAVRMALSLAMDAVPSVLYSGKALALAVNTSSLQKPLSNFYEQERFLHELGVACYVNGADLDAQGLGAPDVRPGIQTISAEECGRLVRRMDFVFTV